MVDPQELIDLPARRFGEVVGEAIARAWAGDVDVSPASPAGVVDAVVTTQWERHAVHVRQSTLIDAPLVRDLVSRSLERGATPPTIVTPGTFTGAAREAAADAGVQLVDGEALAAIVETAGVDVVEGPGPPVSTLVGQLAGRWPEALRERAVELASTIDDLAEFDREVTIGSDRADVDFRPVGTDGPLIRMRFTDVSLLVYVRRGPSLESVVRLTRFRENQPPLAKVAGDFKARVRAAMRERSDEDS